MSLDAMEKVTQAEQDGRERKAAAEAQAKQLTADAERKGCALLEKTRSQAAADGRKMLANAELAAQKRSDEILLQVKQNADALRTAASKRLNTAAKFIVERVVNH